MPLVTVRFTRVFDKLAGEHRGRKYTVFSFDSDIGIRHGASVPAHTAIEAGMCVTAYLDKADCWNSVVGWRNHATGELVLENAFPYRTLLVGAALMASFAQAVVRPLTAHWVVLAMFMLPVLYAWAGLRRIRRARGALEACTEARVQA